MQNLQHEKNLKKDLLFWPEWLILRLDHVLEVINSIEKVASKKKKDRRKKMAKTARIDVPDFDSVRDEFFKVGGAVSTDNVEKIVDGKTFSESYNCYTVSNRAQALALLGGDDNSLWKVVSDWFTARAKRNATSNVTAKANGPERQFAAGIYRLLQSGMPGIREIAVKTVMDGLHMTVEQATEFVNKTEKKYKDAEQKRKDAKVAA
jgi:hypothetical protein